MQLTSFVTLIGRRFRFPNKFSFRFAILRLSGVCVSVSPLWRTLLFGILCLCVELSVIVVVYFSLISMLDVCQVIILISWVTFSPSVICICVHKLLPFCSFDLVHCDGFALFHFHLDRLIHRPFPVDICIFTFFYQAVQSAYHVQLVLSMNCKPFYHVRTWRASLNRIDCSKSRICSGWSFVLLHHICDCIILA